MLPLLSINATKIKINVATPRPHPTAWEGVMDVFFIQIKSLGDFVKDFMDVSDGEEINWYFLNV